MWQKIRKTFVAGLLVLAPITLTIWILFLLFDKLDSILKDSVIQFILGKLGYGSATEPIPGLGLLFLLALIFLTGAITRNYAGRKLIAIGDHVVTHIPLMNRIYIAIREISEAILSEKREVFKKTVLIEYPRKGLYSIAFFTQDTKGLVQDTLKKDVVSVFVPTTPFPTSGYLLFVPKSDITEIDMSVEDALKLVISAGAVYIKDKKGLKQLYKLKNRKTSAAPKNDS